MSETQIDVMEVSEETIRLVNKYARVGYIDSDELTWLARTVGQLVGEVKRLRAWEVISPVRESSS